MRLRTMKALTIRYSYGTYPNNASSCSVFVSEIAKLTNFINHVNSNSNMNCRHRFVNKKYFAVYEK